MSNFTIDHFAYSILLEACIPDTPIGRASIWSDAVDKGYYVMSEEERKKTFDWIQLNPKFNLENKDCKLFYDRYNPDNQYIITYRDDSMTTKIKRKVHTYAFKHKNSFDSIEHYYISSDTYIADEYITNTMKKKSI